MKDSSLVFILFSLGVLIVAGFQIYGSVYSPDKDFNRQVENHLISTVQIKGERINDYFLERKHDALVLAESREVKELLRGEVDSDKSLIEKNIENVLDVISKQIEIFVNKYPDMSFEDLQNDEEFQSIVVREIGETGYTSLVDYDSFDKTMFDYYKQADVKTSEGVSLGVVAKVNLDEFKTLKNASVDLIDFMNRFKEISNYENLILIDSEGYVIYEFDAGTELGTNLEFSAYDNSPLGKAYSQVKNEKIVVVYGPYLKIGNSNLVLLFVAEVYEGGELIGVIALQDSMDDINTISTESTGLGKTGDSYIVDENKFLITPSRIREADLLIQEVETENAERCFDESDEGGVLYFEDFNGDNVIGNHANILEVNWCLVAEIGEQEVFLATKEGKIKQDLIFIVVLNIILLIVGWIFMNRLNKGGRR